MKRFVIDASVGVKWFLPEDGAEAARAYRPGVVRVLVPDIFYAEVANAIRMRVKRGLLQPRDADDLARSLRKHPARILPSRALIPRAMELACASELALYDALYVALAERLNCPLITDDGGQLRAGRSAAKADIRPLISSS